MTSMKYLEELLTPSILNEDNTYVSHSVKYLTAPGDNFGSLMLAVTVKTKNSKDIETTRHLVAKKFPPTLDLQELFNSPLTFSKEIEMYKTIFPVMIQFQKDEGVKHVIDFVPRYHNSLLDKKCSNGHIQNGNGEDCRDNNSVILLENLKVGGYTSCKRRLGFDFDVMKTVLEDLAVFHAVPVAMKLRRPALFREKILPHLKRFYMYDYLDEKMKQNGLEVMLEIMKEDQECWGLEERARETYSLGSTSKAMRAVEPFASISHNDLWVNNVMMRFERGRAVETKLLDFQLIDYSSPGKDVVFFIFSSAQQDVIEDHYDDLVQTYYDKFISTLEECNCDTEEFTFEGLQEELADSARTSQFFHLMIMLQVIFGKENNPEPLGTTEPTAEHKARTWLVVKEFAKRNWL